MCRGRAKLRINLKVDRLVSWPRTTFRIANIAALMRSVFNFVPFAFSVTTRILNIVDAFF